MIPSRRAVRDRHGPEPAVADAGRALAAVRGARLRFAPGTATTSSSPADPTGPYFEAWTLLAGLAAVTAAHPRWRAGQLEHVPPPVAAGQAGGDTRPHLQRSPGHWPGRGLVRARASDVRPGAVAARRTRGALRGSRRAGPQLADATRRRPSTASTTSSTRRPRARGQSSSPARRWSSAATDRACCASSRATPTRGTRSAPSTRCASATRMLDDACASDRPRPDSIVRSLYGWAAMMPSDPWDIGRRLSRHGRPLRRGGRERVPDRSTASRAAGGARTRGGRGAAITALDEPLESVSLAGRVPRARPRAVRGQPALVSDRGRGSDRRRQLRRPARRTTPWRRTTAIRSSST